MINPWVQLALATPVQFFAGWPSTAALTIR